VLLDRGTLEELAPLLRPADFSYGPHVLVWTTLLELHTQRVPVDPVTLGNALRASGRLEAAGGISYLATLARAVPTSANAAHYAQIVRENAYRRHAAEAADLIRAAVQTDGDPARAIEPVLRTLLEETPAAVRDVPVMRATELLTADLPERQDIVAGGLLPRGGLGLLVGPPKAGKTILALSLALAVSLGRRFLEWETTPGRVLYLLGEGGPQLLKERLEAMLGETPSPLPDGLTFSWPENGFRLWLDDPAARAALVRKCKEDRIDLLVVDPLVRFHTKDENSTGDMAELVGNLATLREESGAAVLLVHHTRKPSLRSDKGSAVEARGSSVLHGEVDSALVLSSRRSSGDFTLHFELRWAPEPAPLVLELDPGRLTFKVTGNLDGSRRKLSAKRLRELLEESGPASLDDLARAAGCTTRTVHIYLKELQAEGAVAYRTGPHGAKAWFLKDGEDLFGAE